MPTVTTAASAPEEGVTQAPQAQDPTMAALGTAIRMTQTAQAVAGVGGGGEVTATLGAPGEATAVPPAGSTPAPTIAPTAKPTKTPEQPAAAQCASPYTVKGGDWIYKIARDCKLDPEAIIAANPGINPSVLTPGQKLNLPAAGGAAATGASGQSCTGTHSVVKGENLFRIAYNCGLTTEQMAAANGIPYPYTIFPGQVLKFP